MQLRGDILVALQDDQLKFPESFQNATVHAVAAVRIEEVLPPYERRIEYH